MPPRTLLKLFTPKHLNRSNATCEYRCGNACFTEVPNQTENQYFGDIVAQAISRRTLLKAGAVVGATAAVGLSIDAVNGTRAAQAQPSAFGWTPIAPATDDFVTVPEGYQAQPVMRWGDKLFSSAADFDAENQTEADQLGQFGYNCDFLGFFDIDDSTELMMTNHEYTNPNIMFPDYDAEAPTEEQVKIEWAAHGLSVVAVAKTAGTGELTPIVDHQYNRRFHNGTEFELTGPAAGHELLQTSADPSGTTVLGTLNNCAGGLTPWGTWLTAEENFNQYFANLEAITDADQLAALKRYGLAEGASQRKWEEFDSRFDLAQEPNEPNRFGWIVEVNPWDPTSTPRKRTALGRFKHEAGAVSVSSDGHVAVYMGDDERFDYVYKFVSDGTVSGENAKDGGDPNADLLDNGTLYVARFTGNSPAEEIDGSGALPSDGEFDGTGEWIALVHGDESFVEGMTAAEVLIHTRLAADTVGATKMDRPEDVEPNPLTGRVYLAMTNNTRRSAEEADEANPRGLQGETGSNKDGHVVELIEDGDDPTSTTFTWNLLLVCGDPEDPSTYFGGFDKSQVSPISCPDNVAFDEQGTLWISTDGNTLGAHDGLYAVPLEGAERGHVMQFLSVPNGAECCGPWVTAERVNVAIQHPGENNDADFWTRDSHFPDGGDSLPRPSVMSVWRTTTETPAPTSPAPTTPAPTDPAPTTPAPTSPAPTDSPKPPKLPDTGAGAGLAGVVALGAGAAAIGARLLGRKDQDSDQA
ncbi:PhoX family protein [Parenemella sanctibonifatiensis]|uniref:Phosphatase n=1 Tax=Parenemella sanctibonifatiensis TaxID=2016505 RepID=A0A255EIL9_9ACTN|nr:PhoX family phosphatase [Parenemella sanctibonifatiensis]OYN89465.1 phosphatase [Parenemella sanctibonifatiensis]